MSTPLPANPVCVALDTPDLDRAFELARILKPHVGLVKLGLEFFCANGLAGYGKIAALGVPVFLDLKLHDIPNTVAHALKSLLASAPAPALITLHAAGGRAMLEAARAAATGRTRLVAVTLMTSLSEDDARDIGLDPALRLSAHVEALAGLAQSAGIEGVVCSPMEVAAIRARCGPDFLTVIPGVRPVDSAAGDQKRIATPRAARDAGADILVIGRPITQSSDPVAAAVRIVESLGENP